MLESKAGVLFIAGIGFFGLAFLSNALVPALMYRDLPEQTVEQMLGTTATCGSSSKTWPAGSPTASPRPTASPPRTCARREKWLDQKSRGSPPAGPQGLRGRGLLALP